MKPMQSKKQPTGAMRSVFLTLAVLLLCFCVKQTAFSQTGTITQSISKYDSLLLLAKKGLATMKDYDTLQSYHKRKVDELNDLYTINAQWAYDDSVVRRQNLLLKDSLNGMQVRLITVGNMYTKEHEKKNKPFGVSVMPVGYEPISKRVTWLNVGFTWTPNFLRFSLKGALSGTPAQPTGGTLSDRLRGGY